MPLLLTEISLRARIKELVLLIILFACVELGLKFTAKYLLVDWSDGLKNLVLVPIRYLILLTTSYVIIQRPIALFDKSAVRTYSKALFFMFMLMILANTINFQIDKYISDTWNEVTDLKLSKYEMLFLAVLLAPIVEELFFRGIILSQLLLVFNKNQWIAIVIGGLFFGAVHGEPNQILFNCVMGIGYCFFYWKTKNITITMTCHFMQNFLVFLIKY